jgi:hypothetical protein
VTARPIAVAQKGAELDFPSATRVRFRIINRMGRTRSVWICNTNDRSTRGCDTGRGEGLQQRPSATEARWFSRTSDAGRGWAEATADDPQERNLLAKLLMEQTLQEAAVASLYCATPARTLAVLGPAKRSRSPSSQIAVVVGCLADDRDAIVRVAA